MKIRTFSIVALLVFSLSGAFAQQPAPAPDTPARQTLAPAPTPTPKPGVYDYQELPINDVLRELARKAKINLVIGREVAGAVTLHEENKTPLEVIQIIVDERPNLVYKNFEGVYYVGTQEDWQRFMRNRYFFEAPELPVALAKYEKRYYDALVKEGFTKEEAFKIITSQPLPPHDLSFPRQ